MKKLFIVFIVVIGLFAANAVYGTEPVPANVTVLVNGEEVQFDQEPVIVSGRTLVPLRAIFESLGASVDWEGSTKTVTAQKDATTIVLQVGNPVGMVNNTPMQIDPANPNVEPIIVSGRTLVPARFIAESLGMKVEWTESTRTILIRDAEQASKPTSGLVATELLESRCIDCHTLTRVYMNRTETEWPRIINRMVSLSSYDWTQEEVNIITEFLISEYPR